MLFDRLPHILGPVLVQVMGILDVEHLIGIDFVFTVLEEPDLEGICLAVFIEEGHDHFLATRIGSRIHDHILDLQALDGQQHSCLVLKVGASADGI